MWVCFGALYSVPLINLSDPEGPQCLNYRNSMKILDICPGKTLHIFFFINCFPKWFPSAKYTISVALCVYYHLMFRIFASLMGTKWNRIMVLICISLNTNEIEHLSYVYCLFTISLLWRAVKSWQFFSCPYWFVGMP